MGDFAQCKSDAFRAFHTDAALTRLERQNEQLSLLVQRLTEEIGDMREQLRALERALLYGEADETDDNGDDVVDGDDAGDDDAAATSCTE